MIDPDLKDYDFHIAFPPLNQNEIAKIGDFLRQDQGRPELIGRHIYTDPVTGQDTFTKAECDERFPIVAEQYHQLTRPFRALPSPMTLIVPKLQVDKNGNPIFSESVSLSKVEEEKMIEHAKERGKQILEESKERGKAILDEAKEKVAEIVPPSPSAKREEPFPKEDDEIPNVTIPEPEPPQPGATVVFNGDQFVVDACVEEFAVCCKLTPSGNRSRKNGQDNVCKIPVADLIAA